MLEKLKNIKKEKLYLVLALGAGLFMAVFNPPFAGVPDEHAHYWKASAISEGYWRCTSHDAISSGVYDLPTDIQPKKIKGLEDKKIVVANLKEKLFESRSSETKTIGGAICGASPLSYLPQVAGLRIGNALGFSELASFYLARIFNLLAGVAIVYWAIRVMPFGKIFFIIVGLLPMTLQQFASLSYDSLHISLIFLWTAYVFKTAFSKDAVANRDVAMLAILSVFGLAIKPGYFLLALLIFLIPRKKFKSNARYWLTCLGIFLANLGMFLLMRVIFKDAGDVFKDGVDPNLQLFHALTNPFQFIDAVIVTVYSKIIYFTETFLYKPGWLDNELSPIFYILMILGLVALVKNEDEEVRMEKWQRWLIFGVFLANFFFIFLSLYAVWTKVGAEKIIGVQGRYLLSIAPLLFLSLYKADFRFESGWIRKNRTAAIAAFFVAVFAFAFWSIFRIYYDKSGAGKEGNYSYVRQASTEEVKGIAPSKISGTVAQKFVAKDDYFSGVKIYVGKGVAANDFSFELRDGDCKEVLDRKSIQKDDEEISSIEIKFASRPGSDGQKLCLYSEDFHRSLLEPRMTEGLYHEGELEIGGVKKSGNLVFDLIYKN